MRDVAGRVVVLLVDVEEFSYREAAGILSVPIGTVMSRLNRGRRMGKRWRIEPHLTPNSLKLRTYLDRGYGEGESPGLAGCVRSLMRQSLRQFPVKQGKYREFSQNPGKCREATR